MTQWEYILQCHQHPELVIGDLDSDQVKRFSSVEAAETLLWSLDCLAAMKLRILKIPAGQDWPITGPAGEDQRSTNDF